MSTETGGVEIVVETTALQRQAEEVRRRVRTLRSRVAEVDRLLRRTAGHWQGEAGDDCRQASEEECQWAEEALDSLAKIPDMLLQVSGAYEKLEEEITQQAASLPSDLLL